MRPADRVQDWARVRGTIIRPAEAEDFPSIKLVAASSFPVPVGWVDRPDRAGHYRADFCRPNEFGVMKAAVAVNADRRVIGGYCFYQLRMDGDAYVQELAANPPRRADKVRNGGALLLAFALADALASSGRRNITANVCQFYRATYIPRFASRHWDDPLPFYLKFGFAKYERHAGGYGFASPERDVDDTWVEAPLEPAWDAVQSYLAGSPAEAAPGG